MNSKNTPMTVRELAEMAKAQGVKPSALLPPEGFTLDEDSVGRDGEGVWVGPDIKGQGWTVMSQWTRENGVTFFIDGDGDGDIAAAEAGNIAAALAEVAALAG